MHINLDHLLCYTDAPRSSIALDAYRSAGFNPSRQTARHGGGLRNGFVPIRQEYLELLWVEDERAFSAGHPKMPQLTNPAMRSSGRPFAIGFTAADVHAVHDAWLARDLDLPNVISDGPTNHPPALSIQPIPAKLLVGAHCFVLTYHLDSQPARPVVPRNGIHAVSGVTFVSDVPEHRAVQWRGLLDSCAALTGDDDDVGFTLGRHALRWLTPDRFATIYEQPWRPAPHAQGEIAIVQVLVERLEALELVAKRTDMEFTRLRRADDNGPIALLRTGEGGGFILAAHECARERWRADQEISSVEMAGFAANRG